MSLHLLIGVSLTAGLMAGVAAGQDDASSFDGLARAECAGCPYTWPDGKHRVGPRFEELAYRPAAVFEDTGQSTRLDHADARGVIRSTAKLDGFAAEPYAVITGTRMSFRDIKNGDDHRNCIDNPRRCSASLQGVSRSDLTADPDPPVFEISDDREYGAYLASECITCHQVNGADYGIPSIKGWPRDEFIAAMQAYKTKARTHPVMQMMASRLSDEEIAVLAAYFEGAD